MDRIARMDTCGGVADTCDGCADCQHANVSGGVYEYCEDCGAVRRGRKLGRPPDEWHTCPLCALASGEVSRG